MDNAPIPSRLPEEFHRYFWDINAAKLNPAERSKRDISFKTANFWAHYYGIPREELKCMQEPYRSMRKKSWHN